MNYQFRQNWAFWGLTMFSDVELEAIHNATLDILENPGISVEDNEAVQYLVSAGAIVDSTTGYVRIPKWLTDEAIRTSPGTYVMAGRIRESDFPMEKGRVGFCAVEVADNVRDIYTGKIRPSTKQDVADYSHVVDQLEHYVVNDFHLFPDDVPVESAYLHTFQALIENSTKHICASAANKVDAKGLIAMASEIVGGEEELVKRPILSVLACPVSPLYLTREFSAGLIEFSKHNLPVIAMPMALSGGTGPVTLAGTLIQHNAEVLASLVLTQVVRKGTPFVYGSCTTAMDLRRAQCCTGSVEHSVFTAATARLAQYYNVPYMGPGCWTDSKANDLQAGFEHAFSALLPALAGANLMFGGGCIAGGRVADYAGLVADNDLFGMIQFALKGIPLSSVDMAVDVIREIGPRGEYVTHPHTYEHMRRSQFWPEYCNRDSIQGWEADGSKTMDEITWEKAKMLLDNPVEHPLPEKTVERMEDIIVECEKELGIK